MLAYLPADRCTGVVLEDFCRHSIQRTQRASGRRGGSITSSEGLRAWPELNLFGSPGLSPVCMALIWLID